MVADVTRARSRHLGLTLTGRLTSSLVALTLSASTVAAATVRHIDLLASTKAESSPSPRSLSGFACTAPPALPRAWACPAGGLCPTGGCKDANNTGLNTKESGGSWKQWLRAHNTWRCLHDLPAVRWNNADYDKAWAHFAPATQMQHSANAFRSDSQGENLYWSSGGPEKVPEEMTKAWYDEIAYCTPSADGGATYPDGCKEPATAHAGEMVGHFTALIWKGVTIK